MKKMLFYICFVYLMLISCKADKVLKLSENNILDIKQLKSLKAVNNKKYIVSRSDNNCIEIASKDTYDISKYCEESSLDQKDIRYSEIKKYLSDYKGLKCLILERNNYDSFGNLISSEKLLSDLFPKSNSDFHIPLQNKFLKNKKVFEIKNFEYSISLRDVLIEVMKIYLSDLNKQLTRLPDIGNYENYTVSYENQKLIITPRRDNIITNDVDEALIKMNLKLSIDKDFEENEWRIYFNKNSKTYKVYVDEENRTTSIEIDK